MTLEKLIKLIAEVKKDPLRYSHEDIAEMVYRNNDTIVQALMLLLEKQNAGKY